MELESDSPPTQVSEPDDACSKVAKVRLLAALVCDQLCTVRRERDAAVSAASGARRLLDRFYAQWRMDTLRAKEDVRSLCDEFDHCLVELQRAVQHEYARLDACRERVVERQVREYTQCRDIKRSYACKKEQLDYYKTEADNAAAEADLWKRSYSEVKEKLDDKLYLDMHATCGRCKARERVCHALENQLVQKDGELEAAKAQRDQAACRVDERQRICEMLSATNERLSRELRQVKQHVPRQIKEAVRAREQQIAREGFKQWDAASTLNLIHSQSMPSASPSQPRHGTPNAVVHPSPPTTDTSGNSAGNPFGAWGKGAHAKAVTPTSGSQQRQCDTVAKAEPAASSEQSALVLPPPPAPPTVLTGGVEDPFAVAAIQHMHRRAEGTAGVVHTGSVKRVRKGGAPDEQTAEMARLEEQLAGYQRLCAKYATQLRLAQESEQLLASDTIAGVEKEGRCIGELNRLRATVIDLRQKLNAAQSQASMLSQHRVDVDHVQGELRTMRSELEAARRAAQSGGAQLDAATAELAKKAAECDELRTHLASLEENVRAYIDRDRDRAK